MEKIYGRKFIMAEYENIQKQINQIEKTVYRIEKDTIHLRKDLKKHIEEVWNVYKPIKKILKIFGK